MARVFIALGTNLGEREDNLAGAITYLQNSGGLEVAAKSTVLETAPVDYFDQPDFFNQMLIVETELPPRDLLRLLKGIEARMGRKKTIPKGPRLIDLDIILYDDCIMESEDLTIPHPRRLERDFIVKHLVELDPELRDPVEGKIFREYL